LKETGFLWERSGQMYLPKSNVLGHRPSLFQHISTDCFLKLSIHYFIDFSLPKPAAIVCAIPISEFFSCYEPEPITERLLERIHCLSMPTPTVIKELVQVRCHSGMKSMSFEPFITLG